MMPTLSTFWSLATRELGNHLWQSTLFACVVALLALALRNYSARTRYWLWMAASTKFLIPFVLLIAAGSHFARVTHSTITHATPVRTNGYLAGYSALDAMSQPFTDTSILDSPVAPQSASPHQRFTWPAVLVTVWFLGFAAVLTSWSIQWRRIANLMRRAAPLREGRVIETLRRIERLSGISRRIAVLSSRGSMEPGVFGIFRPVLLWPEAISPHLDDAHLEAVLAHEAAHVHRRDNLTSLLHMLVEAIFWFHPLVWWMESQLVKERERSCDEAVLLLCRQPRAYAEGILKVCELCVESPLTCASGITGSDLKRRIGQIMTASIARKLGVGARLLLLGAGLVAVSVPIMLGEMKGTRVVAAVKAAAHARAGAMSFAARVWSPIEPEPSTPSNTLISLPPVREFQMKEPVKLAQVETASAQTGKQPLTNADVLEMSRAGVPESTIILAIQNTPVKFDFSTKGIVALRAAGITEPVFNQMLRAAKPQQSGASFGVVTGSFPVKDAAGKTVRFSAWIKTENVRNGYAGLWWRVDGPGEGTNRSTLAFDNSEARFIDGKPDTGNCTVRGATGTTPWTLYEFELPIGTTATNINFGVLFTGTGTAWVDSMKVELDGEPYSNPQIDFDFESPKVKGFYAGCGGSADCGYKVGIDDTVFYYGHQSLKMQYVGDGVAQTSCGWPEPLKTNPENLDFADGAVGAAPKGWLLGQRGVPPYEAINVPAEECHGGQQCATVRSLRGDPSVSSLSFLYQNLDVTQHRGQTLIYRAFVRVDPSQKSVARLLVRLHRRDCSTTFRDDMGDHPIMSGDWALYEIRAPIAEDAYHMEFGVQLVGTGALWIDQISMEFKSALGN
jgi:beta-lactamase regulating signal transducer with metallopeptidase domain